jgi:2-iminobutanoate/2-iminopropanoate deaminase
VLVGNTPYVAATAWFDKTDKPPASVEDEARLAMDSVKRVLESHGMAMDDLVSVQVYCTDLSLYDKFNGVYRTYFHDQFPARVFVGVASLIRAAHFELTGVAVKRAKQ